MNLNPKFLSTLAIFMFGVFAGSIMSLGPSTEATINPVVPISASHPANPQPPGIAPKDIECLAKTIYFEARNESLAGKLAVGLVVLNRTESQKFPRNTCAVVEQGRYTGTTIAKRAKPNMKACQFSWYCDGLSDDIEKIIQTSRKRQRLPQHIKTVEETMWEQSKAIAQVVLEGRVYDFTDDATHYHADSIHPRWAERLVKIGSIDSHTFYRE